MCSCVVLTYPSNVQLRSSTSQRQNTPSTKINSTKRAESASSPALSSSSKLFLTQTRHASRFHDHPYETPHSSRILRHFEPLLYRPYELVLDRENPGSNETRRWVEVGSPIGIEGECGGSLRSEVWIKGRSHEEGEGETSCG